MPCERRRASLGIRKGRARAHRAGSIPRRCDLSLHRSRIDACRQASIPLALAGAEFVVFTSRTQKSKTPRGQASRGVRFAREVGLNRPPSRRCQVGFARGNSRCGIAQASACRPRRAALCTRFPLLESTSFMTRFSDFFTRTMREAAHLTPVVRGAQVKFAKR